MLLPIPFQAKSSIWSFFLCLMVTEEGEGLDGSSSIPLDDVVQVDFGAVEVVQCLIEHHSAIFTDVDETVWR